MSEIRGHQYKRVVVALFAANALLFTLACGRTGLNENEASLRIYGGAPVPSGDFTTVVALHDPNRVVCTGTLIHPQVILTAAHCAETRPGSSALTGVSFGQGREGGRKPSQQPIAATAIHPEFRHHPRGNMDIGLVFLDQPALGPSSSPSSLLSDPKKARLIFKTSVLPANDLNTAPQLTMVGYGRREDGGTGKKYVVTAPASQMNPSELALGGAGKDSCEGDSGGPVFDQHGSLYGVISRGLNIGCGGGGVASVVADAACWIHDESLARGFDIPVAQPCGNSLAQKEALRSAVLADEPVGSTLNLSEWYLESIADLHDIMPNATSINLKGNHLKDISDLFRLPALRVVDISFNDVPSSQIELLQRFGIQVLGIHTQASTFLDTRFLSTCLQTDQTKLPIENQAMIRALKARFASNDCKSINSRLVKTIHLNLSSRNLTDLNLLADLPLLEHLILSDNPVVSLEPLLSLEKLKSLKLGNMPPALLESDDLTLSSLIAKGVAIEFGTTP